MTNLLDCDFVVSYYFHFLTDTIEKVTDLLIAPAAMA